MVPTRINSHDEVKTSQKSMRSKRTPLVLGIPFNKPLVTEQNDEIIGQLFANDNQDSRERPVLHTRERSDISSQMDMRS
jgi:hypothetical protein